MKLKQAKEYFNLGVITQFEAVRLGMTDNDWILHIHGKEGRFWMLETALGQTKRYASLDTLVAEVEAIQGHQVKSVTVG